MKPTLDAVASGRSGITGSTLSFNHILGNITNPLIIVGITGEDFSSSSDPIVTGVTYNGIAMTRIGAVQGPSGSHIAEVELWALWGSSIPVAGTYAVSITYAGNCESRAAGCASFALIKPQTAEAVGSKADNGTTSCIATLTTLTNFALLFSVSGSQNGGAVTHESDWTEAWQVGTGSGEECINSGAFKIVESPGFQTIKETISNPESEGMVVASFAFQSIGGGYFI